MCLVSASRNAWFHAPAAHTETVGWTSLTHSVRRRCTGRGLVECGKAGRRALGHVSVAFTERIRRTGAAHPVCGAGARCGLVCASQTLTRTEVDVSLTQAEESVHAVGTNTICR